MLFHKKIKHIFRYKTVLNEDIRNQIPWDSPSCGKSEEKYLLTTAGVAKAFAARFVYIRSEGNDSRASLKESLRSGSSCLTPRGKLTGKQTNSKRWKIINVITFSKRKTNVIRIRNRSSVK